MAKKPNPAYEAARSLFEPFQPLNETTKRTPYRIPECYRKTAAETILEALEGNPELLFMAVFYSGYVLTNEETKKVAEFILSLLEPTQCLKNLPER